MVFWLIPILVQIAISVALTAIAYLLMPKPKQEKPEVRDLEDPTASAGRPIPVLFGTKKIKGVNILWYGEKTSFSYRVDL